MVQVIGPLMVRRGPHVLTRKELGGPRQRQLLEVLLLNLGTPVPKTGLVELLWGPSPPAAAPANLESYVSVLRRGLQPGGGRSGPLRTTNGGYVMAAPMVDLDLRRFDLLLERARCSRPQEAHPLLCRALELASAPLLEDELLCEWTQTQRDLHAARVGEARVLAAETALDLGLPAETIAQARTVLAEDPLNERAWTALVLGLERSDRPVEGLQAFERCRQTFGRELGCSPTAALRAAQERMLRTTAESPGELGRVLSAMLVLYCPDGGTHSPAEPAARMARAEAVAVIRAFLGRAVGGAR